MDWHQDLLVSSSKENNLSLSDLEKKYIEAVLKSMNYNKMRTATVLGIGLNTLYRKLRRYEIIEKNR